MVVRPEQYGNIRYPTILFGDNEWGRIVSDEPPHKRNDGIVLKRYLINPSPHLVKTYPEIQKKNVLWKNTNLGWALWREYPIYYINDKHLSYSNPIVRIDCGFDGKETPETERVRHYEEMIKELMQENDRMKLRVELLKQENRELSENLLSRAKKYSEIVGTMRGSQVDEHEDNIPMDSG